MPVMLFVIPVMVVYYLIDKSLLTEAAADTGVLSPAERSWFKIYAEVEAISNMLFFDLSYFTSFTRESEFSLTNFALYYLINFNLLLSVPFAPLMIFWFFNSALVIAIMYIVFVSTGKELSTYGII